MTNLDQAISELQNQVAKPRRRGKHGGKRTGAGRPKGSGIKSPEERYAASGHRQPFTRKREPVVPSEALGEFVMLVQHERNTFARRVIPDQTITCNFDGSQFTWPASHALTVARDYAASDEIPTGALMRLAKQRFLDDINSGASRGLYLDPEAAKNIATWFTEFNIPGFVLQPWQMFVLVQIFAWKQANGLRRFREAWLEVAKKNGKTTLMAGIALFMLLADGEPKTEVYSAANSKEQARICFRSAKHILEECQHLRQAVRIYHNAFVAPGGDFYHPLSADTKAIDGPNVAVALFDEVHEFSDSVLWDKLTAGTIARTQPLVMSCTTAGESQSGFAWERHALFVKLLSGVAPDDGKLIIIYAIDDGDDWKDESVWVKSNPNLHVTVRVEALREQIQEIESYPQKLTPFLRYHQNTWVTLGASHTLPIDKINACAGPYNLKPIELRNWFLEHAQEWPAYGGFDLGVVEDMTAFVGFYPDVRFADTPSEQPPYMVAVPWFWIPEERVEEKKRLWNVPLDVWIREGWVRTTPGNYVDVKHIKADLKDILWTTGKFRDLGFDAWNAQVLMSEIHDEKIAKCTRVPQHEGFLTAPAQELIRAVVQSRFVHLKNPVLVWQLANVVLEPNDRGGIVAKKLSKSEKIDAVQALLSAMQRYLNPDEADKFRYTSIYNQRGVVTI